MITYTDNVRKEKHKQLGISFVYLSDEFFIRAGRSLPGNEYYDDFYQIENGVGEFRDMIDQFNRAASRFPHKIARPKTITWVTGTLAAGNLEKYIIHKLRQIENLDIELIPVKNEFYGEAITVSGLLVGQDIYNQLKNHSLGNLVLLPPRVLNHNGLFLDDWTLPGLIEKLGTSCHVYTEAWADFPDVIERY